MPEFSHYLPKILRHEGGFVNDPDDPGGATNKGVTLETFRRYAVSDLGVEPTLENLKQLTDDQAGIIYKKRYWDRLRGDEISDSELAYHVTDFYINAGNNAVKVLQQTLNELGAEPPLVVDGLFGKNTLRAMNAADAAAVYVAFRNNRIAYYERIAERRPALQKFLRGWRNRANSFDHY